MVKQITVFIENKPGRLMEMLKALAKNDIDIKAFSLADTTEFGIARMIVSDENAAKKAIDDEGVVARICNIITTAVPDEPGALMKALEILKNNGISIEYMYAFAEKLDGASVIAIRTDNQELANETLSKGGVKVLDQSDIEKL